MDDKRRHERPFTASRTLWLRRIAGAAQSPIFLSGGMPSLRLEVCQCSRATCLCNSWMILVPGEVFTSLWRCEARKRKQTSRNVCNHGPFNARASAASEPIRIKPMSMALREKGSQILPQNIRAHRRWIPRELSSSPPQTSGGQHRIAGSSIDR